STPQRLAVATIGFVTHVPHLLMLSPEPLCLGRRAITAPVVDDDDLKTWRDLRQHFEGTLHQRRQVALLVVGGKKIRDGARPGAGRWASKRCGGTGRGRMSRPGS